MKLNIMKKDESFIGIYGNKIALKNKKGEIRIVSIVLEEDVIRVDNDAEVTIGFGNGEVIVGDMDDSIEVTTF
ncbi:MAG: hypothetical protein K6F69_06080 [Treponema sp.]|nr:hypothetical protein [Treponema sp.]